MITIFTDGSSRGNPGPGGWGAIIVDDESGRVTELGNGGYETTNNKMEILAAINALGHVAKDIEKKAENTENAEKSSTIKITVYADSTYLINSITKWVKGWQAKDWITSGKKPVESRDLWEKLIKETEAIGPENISWKYVGGHIGVAGNERGDEIATMFADKQEPKLFAGSLKDYPIKNILDVFGSVDLTEQKANQKSVETRAAKAAKKHSSATAYSYVSAVDGKIQTHKTWQECEVRVRGARGARYKKVFSAEEERRVVTQFEELPSQKSFRMLQQ